MSIVIDWYDANQDILLVRIWGDWTLEETLSAIQHSQRMYHARPYPVDFIVDVREVKGLPYNLQTHMLHVLQTAPPNVGRIAIVTSNTLYRKIGAAIAYNSGWKHNIFFVRDVQCALRRLAEVREG